MTATNCQNCGASVPAAARTCSYCGAPNPSRRSPWPLIIGATLLLLIAAGGAAFYFLQGQTGPARVEGTSAEQRGGSDFAWLEAAMKQCDAEATKDAKSLMFLVTPLVDEPKDDPGWRRIALNDIGNAILINAEDTLAGLRRKALVISKGEYTFRIRNDETREVFAWKPTVGVRRFSTAAPGITSFRAQFQSSDPSRAVEWGAAIARQEGNCYWVNAILRQ